MAASKSKEPSKETNLNLGKKHGRCFQWGTTELGKTTTHAEDQVLLHTKWNNIISEPVSQNNPLLSYTASIACLEKEGSL